VREVWLETATDNESAIAFWKKHGYRTCGTRRGYPGGRDAFSMEKRSASPAKSKRADKHATVEAVVLAIVQGLTEFFAGQQQRTPDSDSLAVQGRIPDPGMAFDVALHLGTLIAVGSVFFARLGCG